MDEINKSLEVAKLFQEVMFLSKHNMGKVFEEYGITAPQAMVMGILRCHKRMKITELSSKLSLPNSTVSGIVDRLENLGIATRERSKEDKRVVYVTISPSFEEMHIKIRQQVEKNTEAVLSNGTPEELDKVFEGLTILKKLLNENLK